MLFNSLQFGIFFIIVFTLYLALKHRLQNRLLLVASYVFYGCWDWRFLSLIWISTIIDYVCGLKLDQSQNQHLRKRFLMISIVANLGMLGVFKYFNFFADSFRDLASTVGWQVDPVTLSVVLPVGISFYTFQTMSYTIDVYRREMKATNQFWDYALYVAFFPQLVAGPIERAKRLLPQVLSPRKLEWEKIKSGLVLFGWGLFKKVVIADNMARIVNAVYSQGEGVAGSHVWIATYAFAVQIYADFSGYSDMARGLAKMLGFDLMVNFNLPYFAKNPSDFWRRWHISLSTWLRDYLYIPLGGNRKGRFKTSLNMMITMVLGGLWHGAAWTFVIWGFLHGLMLGVHRWAQGISLFKVPDNNVVWSVIRIFVMFQLVCLGWLFFRAESLSQAILFIQALGTNWNYNWETLQWVREFLFFASPLIIVQLIQYFGKEMSLHVSLPKTSKVFLAAFICCIIIISACVGLPTAREFIYFQF